MEIEDSFILGNELEDVEHFYTNLKVHPDESLALLPRLTLPNTYFPLSIITNQILYPFNSPNLQLFEFH